jgi:hypothetical protein
MPCPYRFRYAQSTNRIDIFCRVFINDLTTLEARTIENIEARIKKKGRNLVIYPDKCPMSLSICLWKQNSSRIWDEIERCYAYAGHKDKLVKCKWKETFFNEKKTGKKRSSVKSKTNVSGAITRTKR